MAARKILSPTEINQTSEVFISLLRGLPVSHALAVLEITKSNLLYLATVSKPEEEPPVPVQIDLEDFISQKPRPYAVVTTG